MPDEIQPKPEVKKKKDKKWVSYNLIPGSVAVQWRELRDAIRIEHGKNNKDFIAWFRLSGNKQSPVSKEIILRSMFLVASTHKEEIQQNIVDILKARFKDQEDAFRNKQLEEYHRLEQELRLAGKLR